MTTYSKVKLSGSTDGRGIKVAATSTPGTTIHTAVAGTSSFDEVWVWIFNSDTTDIVLTIEYGGTTAPDDNIVQTIVAKTGLTLVVPGLILQNTSIIKAFAGTANKLVAFGYINRIV